VLNILTPVLKTWLFLQLTAKATSMSNLTFDDSDVGYPKENSRDIITYDDHS
jgi:hypothetical protein